MKNRNWKEYPDHIFYIGSEQQPDVQAVAVSLGDDRWSPQLWGPAGKFSVVYTTTDVYFKTKVEGEPRKFALSTAKSKLLKLLRDSAWLEIARTGVIPEGKSRKTFAACNARQVG